MRSDVKHATLISELLRRNDIRASRFIRSDAPCPILLFFAFDHAVTVWRQLIYAYPGKRAKLTFGIFLEVCLDQRRVVALADGSQNDNSISGRADPDANGVFPNRFQTNSGKSDEAALRILLEIGFVLVGENAVFY